MGAIMAVGVAVANAILLVTFAEKRGRRRSATRRYRAGGSGMEAIEARGTGPPDPDDAASPCWPA